MMKYLSNKNLATFGVMLCSLTIAAIAGVYINRDQTPMPQAASVTSVAKPAVISSCNAKLLAASSTGLGLSQKDLILGQGLLSLFNGISKPNSETTALAKVLCNS